ncbi:MAG: hypothetical protein JO202_10980 [Ktedonobacteraceae bacterium]|nr:hypothetical protein [Ktedonobacteraceae bacterium]
MSETAAVQALHRTQQRVRALEAYIAWEDRLFSNPHLSATHKLELRATRRAIERGQTHDEQGRTRINLRTIAQQIGVSPDTVGRGLKLFEQVGVLSRDVQAETQDNGERWTRVYASLQEEMLQTPETIAPPAPRKHGGPRYRCPKCGSAEVKIQRRLVCPCGHQSILEEHAQEAPGQETVQEPSNASPTEACVCPPPDPITDILEPDSPPMQGKESGEDDLGAGAALLLAIAGESQDHIQMSKSGPAKYYTVHRPLTLVDTQSHLQGGNARGARCHYESGQTRALCWDCDEAEAWLCVEQAARQLAHAGYLPILEPSPAGRGGHLWLVFDGLVDVAAAQAHSYVCAPYLAEVPESWPSAHGNKVRLPGGRYVRPGVAAWCRLISVVDGEMSHDGQSAARLLLTHQTPTRVVLATCPERTVHEAPQQPRPEPPQGGIDGHWLATYGNDNGFWFAFTPAYVAAWYNRQHALDELLPSERNGYGLATWRGERTASVAKRGETWTDFGAGARRPDGTHDGGDALELQVRVSQQPKAEVLREAARAFVQEARAALEGAAWCGEPIPAWLEQIITQAGRAHYAQIAAGAVRAGSHSAHTQTTGGLAGFSPVSKMPPDNEAFTGSAGVVAPSSAGRSPSLQAEMQRLEQIKAWGRAHHWPRLVLGEEEVIPEGRAAWLRFLWLSGESEQQGCVYEYLSQEGG